MSNYNPNSDYYLARARKKAERRLRELGLREDMARISRQLAALEDIKTIYPENDRPCVHVWCDEPFDGVLSCKICGAISAPPSAA